MKESRSYHHDIPENGLLRIGNDLTINIYKNNLESRSSGKSTKLTRNEFGFFLLLATFEGEIVDYTTVAREIWDDDDIRVAVKKGDKGRIWMLANRLKEKFNNLESNFVIKTHQKKGYSLFLKTEEKPWF